MDTSYTFLFVHQWLFFNVHMQINEIATYTSCKLKYTLIPGLVNRACVCVCVSATYQVSFLISVRCWQQTLFLWQKIFYWLYQIKSFCKIIFGSVSDDSLTELENSVHWQSLKLYFLLFPFSSLGSVFLSYIVIEGAAM